MMKSSAAFALGLWTGAVVVAAIGAFQLRGLARVAREPSPQLAKQLQDKDEQIQQLHQEQSRLLAEEARLRQTVSELKVDLDKQAIIETRRENRDVRRRIPFRKTDGEGPDESWIAEAVANGDANALPQLQAAALQGSQSALDALASLADRDGADGLTRVWLSDSLSAPLRMRAARLLAATLELNPHGEQLLQTLFAAPDADPKLLAAALDGLVNPPRGRQTDYVQRFRLVDTLRAQTTDPDLLANLDRAREQLATAAAQVVVPVQ